MSQSPKKRKSSKKKSNARTGSRSTPIILAVVGVLVIGAAAAFAVGNRKSSSNIAQDDYVPEVAGQPSLKADRTEIDLGDVKLGKTVSASFVLTNVGDEALRFSEIPYVELKEGC
jgi:hypothetical protein